MNALFQSGRGLLLLFFRVYGVCFLLVYPLCKLTFGLFSRPWFIDPITHGIKLTLSPLRDLRQRVNLHRQVGEMTGERPQLLLPAPSPPKRDINQATVEELRLMEGVGFVRALEIVEYRERFGDYRRMEELGLIKGVGAQTMRLLSETFEVK